MTMTDVNICVPQTIVQFTKTEDKNMQNLRNAMLLFPYIKNETISYGKAAELLGMKKIDLISLYGSLGICYFDETEEELDSDIFSIQKLKGLK